MEETQKQTKKKDEGSLRIIYSKEFLLRFLKERKEGWEETPRGFRLEDIAASIREFQQEHGIEIYYFDQEKPIEDESNNVAKMQILRDLEGYIILGYVKVDCNQKPCCVRLTAFGDYTAKLFESIETRIRRK